jgi:pyrophosphatase PpaX
MNKYLCIIFDVDGTLTQTNELIFASFNFVSSKYLGKTFTPQEITAMFGPPDEIAIMNLVGKDNADAALIDFLDFYKTNHASMAKLYDGVDELLNYLKQKGILLAVFTGKGRLSAMISLEELGIKKYFDLIVSGSDVVNHKPSSEGIQKAVDYFGLEKDKVLMVGDAVADVKAAHEAGVPIAAVVWDSYGREKVEKMSVDFLFESVDELYTYLKSNINGDVN